MLIHNSDFGKAEEELLDTYIVETDGGLGIDARTIEGKDFPAAKAGVLHMAAYGKGYLVGGLWLLVV